MSARGSFLFDAVFVIMLLFVLMIAGIATSMLLGKANAAFQADPNIPAAAKDNIASSNSQFPKVIDFWIVLLLVGLPLISMGLGFFTNIPSIFFWLGIGASFVVAWIAYAFQEAWTSMLLDAQISSYSSLMPVSSWVFSHYMWYVGFVIVVIGVGTYAKVGQS